jgi:6-pyruvoyltetrahydropterin/6-carboxytetrahydropterin synthase
MFSISKSFSFCYGHRLLGDKGKCRNLHGHTARVVIHLESEGLDENGMVCHFDNLKGTIGKWIEENLDHSMLLSKDDPAAKALKELDERLYVMETNPTAENIARLIHDQAISQRLPVTRVEMWESDTAKAVFEG